MTSRPKTIPDAPEVIKLKLETVNRYIETCEICIDRIHGAMLSDAATLTDVGDTLTVLKRGLAEFAKIGVATSLIDVDLLAAKKNFGVEHHSKVNQLVQSIQIRMEQLVQHTDDRPDNERATTLVWHLAADMIELFRASLQPARKLRSELITALNEKASHKQPTSKQQIRQARDKRIRELTWEHTTESPARLAEICKTDPIIERLGVEVTKETVRNVLNPRGKKR